MPASRVTGRRGASTLAVFCLLALLVGTLSGCQGRLSAVTPSSLPPGETPAETSSLPATPTLEPAAAQARAAAGEWLRANAIPFETTEPGSGFEDLMPLKELIGDARIVALGEATHGTHEFFQMKHRLVEFLVEEMGFNLFAIEANWPEANLINDYVHTCEGDPAELLVAGLGFWTWNTQEVLDMIRWMCAHNQYPGDAPRISFAGFDMQNPDMAIANVTSFLEEVESPYTETAIDRYLCIRLHSHSSYATLSDKKRMACRSDLQEVLDHLIAQRETYEKLSSPEEFVVVEQSARIVLQAEDFFASTSDRDRYMAKNVVWLLEEAGPDAKIILWAHNAHIANRETSSWRSMGSYLKETYGEELVILGFAFDHGSFNAYTCDFEADQCGELDSHYIPAASADSYEWYFTAAGIPQMILDLRDVSTTSPATAWLEGPRRFHSVGAAYNPDFPEPYSREYDLVTEFDVIIYFEETTPSILLGR